MSTLIGKTRDRVPREIPNLNTREAYDSQDAMAVRV